jgi:hypothetical protein
VVTLQKVTLFNKIMKIYCFNKALKEMLPAEKAVSKDKLFWLEAMLNSSPTKTYEETFYIFSYAKD